MRNKQAFNACEGSNRCINWRVSDFLFLIILNLFRLSINIELSDVYLNWNTNKQDKNQQT